MKACFLLIFSGTIFAEQKARFVVTEATKQGSVEKVLEYTKAQINQMSVPSEKRGVIIFLAGLQEQLGLYEEAQATYAKAAGISAGDAEEMPKKSNEQLVLDAVRCALNYGEYTLANRYLNSAVRNSKSENIQAYVKLYEQWSALCEAEKSEDVIEPLEILKTYAKLPSMKSVHPAILLTLWYISGDSSYAEEIKKTFANSTEASIVKGDIQLLPLPFWFFVPKLGVAEQGVGTFSQGIENTETVVVKKSEPNQKFTKWQLGLFKTENNAKLLCDELKKKSFDAFVVSEKRASGTTYYIVLVNEDSNGSVADKLRSSGYDCYPVD
ncbi:MAG: SPOR domain-containing protein [Treponema sp.]|nr:SPOR domain-containing protein [Treponema sp.]